MSMQGSIVPKRYLNDYAAAPYPTLAAPGIASAEVGEMFTCSFTGRTWLISDVSPNILPLALQWQTTSAGAGTTTANIRRVNSGTAGSEVAGFEHTGAVVLSDLVSAPMLGTNTSGKIVSVSNAPTATYATTAGSATTATTANYATSAGSATTAGSAAAADTVRILVRNNTGSQVDKGKAVRISGALGQNATISLAQANAYATTDAVGLAAENIANNATGYVIIAGTLTDLNTSAFADGAGLYLSATTPGGLTATEPVKPNWQMQIGTVQHAHPTQGTILVHPNLESVKTEYIADMTSGGTALATLAPMAESTLLGRGAGSGSGDPQSISLGYAFSMSGVGTTLAASLSYDSRFLTGDVTLTNANTIYDIVTITLAAGVWLVMGSATFTSGTAATTNYTVEIYNDASASTVGSSSASHAAVANLPVNASCNAVVNLASSTVIRLRGIASQNTRTVKYQSNPGNRNNATGLVAIRIG